MATLTQGIQGAIRVRAQLDEASALSLLVQVSAPYGTSVNAGTGPECSIDVGSTIPNELRTPLTAALAAIRAYAESHSARAIQRAIAVSRETALRLGEITED